MFGVNKNERKMFFNNIKYIISSITVATLEERYRLMIVVPTNMRGMRDIE
jgi:hypothetical protein